MQLFCSCNKCHTAFGFITRKHNCRVCGGVFCNKCSNRMISMSRVCEDCYIQGGGDEILSSGKKLKEKTPAKAQAPPPVVYMRFALQRPPLLLLTLLI
jgi:hypothetical protein